MDLMWGYLVQLQNLSNRRFCVSLNNYISSLSSVKYGVPQGLVLGPTLFPLYMLPLGHIMQRHGVSFYFNADDTKINLPVGSTDPGMLSSLNGCLCGVKSWESKYLLLLNSNKTEILVIGPTAQDKTNSASSGPLLDHIKPAEGNLGVWLTVMSSFEQHTTKLVRSCFNHLGKNTIYLYV